MLGSSSASGLSPLMEHLQSYCFLTQACFEVGPPEKVGDWKSGELQRGH